MNISAVVWRIHRNQNTGKATNFFTLELDDAVGFECMLAQRQSGDMSFYINWPSDKFQSRDNPPRTMYKTQASVFNKQLAAHITQGVVAIFNQKDAQGNPTNYIAPGSTYYQRQEEKKQKAQQYQNAQTQGGPPQYQQQGGYPQQPPNPYNQQTYTPAPPVYQPQQYQPAAPQQFPPQQAPPQMAPQGTYPPQQQPAAQIPPAQATYPPQQYVPPAQPPVNPNQVPTQAAPPQTPGVQYPNNGTPDYMK